LATQGPAETLHAALIALRNAGLDLLVVSRFYVTPCFPVGAGPDYVNAAACVDAGQLDAASVLDVLHDIEASYGRTRTTRWAGRVLDLDLLAMGDQVLPDRKTHARWQGLVPADQARMTPDQLILPHPRLADRAFVLVPLADIAPDWCHPMTGLSVVQMRDALPPGDVASVRALPQGFAVDPEKPG
jgi:2-amino-4-hydroxy-6-hydroxymethyldihydropteridine diphosphokinase